MSYPLKDLVGLLLILICCILFLIFICRFKNDLMKLLGVFLVIALSLVSDSGTNYFLTILVVATLVTELEFLQNITAIIRNSDTYFKHRYQNEEEIKASIVAEAEEIDEALESEDEGSKINVEFDSSNLTPMQFGIIAEELTFKFLERKYGKNIRRYVLLSEGAFGKVEFDGVLEDKDKLTLIEIKSSLKGYVPLSIINRTLSKNIEVIRDISSKIKKDVEFMLIIVGEYNESQVDKINKIVQNISQRSAFIVTIEIITFEQIGMDMKLIKGV